MSERAVLHDCLVQGIAALGLTLPAGVVSRLLDYQALLARWNGVYNLTAVRDDVQMVTRHLLDSLAILPYVQGQTLVDLGSGAGLPGLVLALAAPDRKTLLVDANGKKIRFLREVIRTLKIDNVSTLQARVETLQGHYDCVTSRAFASLPDMLHWAGHLLAEQGMWLAMKGHYPVSELAHIPPAFVPHKVLDLNVPGLAGKRSLVILTRSREIDPGKLLKQW